MNEKTINAKISDIQIGPRVRKDIGDVEGLAASLQEEGLLQPIGITANYDLVFGHRRLLAYRDVLGREAIPARIVDVTSVLHGQFAENLVRKQYTVSERLAIAEQLHNFRHGGDRRSDQARNREDEPLTLDEVGKIVGLGGKDGVVRARKVRDHGVPELQQAMDSGKFAISKAEKIAGLPAEDQRESVRLGKVVVRRSPNELCVTPQRGEGSDDNEKDVLPLITADLCRINSIEQGDCRQLISRLPDASVSLVATSPPYADQRKGEYPGVPEDRYPDFTLEWMGALWDKLADHGSVLIVIDPHVKGGVLSDYILRTQLALREGGWKQHMPLIWLKRNRGPLGHSGWPRHSYESILWFSKTDKPFCDPWANGKPTDRVGMNGYAYSERTNAGKPVKEGVARISDVFDVPISNNEKGVDHPAKCPVALMEALISTFCRPDGAVLDPFAGSGTTLLAAKRLRRNYYGFEIEPKYVELTEKRLREEDRFDEAG